MIEYIPAYRVTRQAKWKPGVVWVQGLRFKDQFEHPVSHVGLNFNDDNRFWTYALDPSLAWDLGVALLGEAKDLL